MIRLLHWIFTYILTIYASPSAKAKAGPGLERGAEMSDGGGAWIALGVLDHNQTKNLQFADIRPYKPPHV